MVQEKSIFLALVALVVLVSLFVVNNKDVTRQFQGTLLNSSVNDETQDAEEEEKIADSDFELYTTPLASLSSASPDDVVVRKDGSAYIEDCAGTNADYYSYFSNLMWLSADTGRWNIRRDRAGPLDERRWEEFAKRGTYSEFNTSQLPMNSFCQKRVVFPLTTNHLLHHLRNKKLLFLGDSIARNHFVLMMARLCNFNNIDKCHTRMPTHEYDMDQDDMTIRGPMGCVPKDGLSDGSPSPCYQDGNFSYMPIAGLTLKELSVKKKALRKKFVKGGFIPPAMVMRLDQHNITLMYISVIRPQGVEKVTAHMARRRSVLSDVDAIIVSVGPHMTSFELQYLNVTYPRSMRALRAVTRAPILIAEITHHLEDALPYASFTDDMLNRTVHEINRIYPDPPLVVPQRYVTSKKFKLMSPVVAAADEMGVQKGCGYYDKQHPAVRCNLVLTEIMFGALLSKLARQPNVSTIV